MSCKHSTGCPALIKKYQNYGTWEKTRTFTAVRPLAPEASVSTNSTTQAGVSGAHYSVMLLSVNRTCLNLQDLCGQGLHSARAKGNVVMVVMT